MPVYAIQSGKVLYAGGAQGYGGPDPAGWLVIDSDDPDGGGVFEYGHIRRLENVKIGSRVVAGQQIAVINPDPNTNGGVGSHLHLSYMPGGYDPASKQDPMPLLKKAREPEAISMLNKPDFNEYPLWSDNHESRGGTEVDLFLLHTEEGSSVKNGADRLARWMQNPAVQVSYHYTISQDPDDGGVTVCDVVDTDDASWSALSANRRSINLVFAGSKVSWTREQWMQQSNALDVAAFLAVQDSKKYKFLAKVIAPPYASGPPGISDHNFVTKKLRDGSHSDVGQNFPWQFFSQRVAFWLAGGVEAKPKPPVVTVAPVGPADDQLTMRWNALGGQTLVEAVAEIRDHLLGTSDKGKSGVK